MDFSRAFEEIDTDGSGDITTEELDIYMTKRNYKPEFKQKWLSLFDTDGDGVITYKEFCDTLGLVPKKEIVEKAEKVKEEKRKISQIQEPIVCQKAQATYRGAPPQPVKSKKTEDDKEDSSNKGKNYEISNGIMRYAKNVMVEKKKLHRYSKTAGFDKKLKRLQKSVAGIESNEKKEEIKMKTKTIGGDKNGETRQVLESKDPRFFPAESPPKRKHLRRNPVFSEHKRRLKSGLVPGAVLILLSGIHRGKRVVFLKQLKSGLLLVTGPYKLNGCPLRRINQIYTIATSTRIDVNGINIPKRLTDVYFKRAPKKDRKKNSTDIFTENKVDYKASDERKEDQRLVDNQIIAQIKKNKDDKKLLFQYLASMFSLSKKDYPHKMKF